MVLSSLNLLATSSLSVPLGVPTMLSFPASSLGAPIRPRHAMFSVEGNAVRWGKNPTGQTGTIVQVGGQLREFMDPGNDYTNILQNLAFVALNGPATIQCQFFS